MASPRLQIRDLGYRPGTLPTGPKNSILDVAGVTIGQATKIVGDTVRSGVTVILPRGLDGILEPCYAGMHTLNGNGEVTGSYQIKDWGFVNTPIALTNSTSLGIVHHTIWEQLLQHQKGLGIPDQQIGRNYGSPVVAETCDWWLNDIFACTLSGSHVEEALQSAISGKASVQEGQYGGGAGMTCHMFTGGTGTSSRLIDGEKDGETVTGQYTVGVLVQANYGYKSDLQIGGVPVGKLLMKKDGKMVVPFNEASDTVDVAERGGRRGDGSIVVIIITDAPMMPHQLVRLAQRAGLGIAQVGGHGTARNSSGDIFLAISTANRHTEHLKGEKPYHAHPRLETNSLNVMINESIDATFRACSEATEEAILNCLCAGREGRKGHEASPDGLSGFPVERVKAILEKYSVVL